MPSNLLPITCIIHTLNEEKNIVACLDCLKGRVQEIIVWDMNSDDQTLTLAKKYTEKVFVVPQIKNFDGARNDSALKASQPWVFYVDADERVPAALWPFLEELIKKEGEKIAGLQFCYKNHFIDQWMKHGPWWPGYKAPMFLKKGCFEWREEVHVGPIVKGQIFKMPSGNEELVIEHFSFPSIESYVERLNRYTSMEVDKLTALNEPNDWKKMLEVMVADWKLYYEKNDGSKDGMTGFILAVLSSFYPFVARAKYYENQLKSGKLSAEEKNVPSIDDVYNQLKNLIT